MRVSTAFKHLLRLPGVHVRAVAFEPERVVVTVVLRRRRLRCPGCAFATRSRYDRRDVDRADRLAPSVTSLLPS